MPFSEYITLARPAESEFTEKKSVFIGNAAPVKTEEEAIAFIQKIKKKYSDAKHNVYAYALRENNITRYSDDAEPKGTAGLPTLEVIKKSGICDAVIVTTRYFGGILLGTGGLTRAYTQAASDAAEKAGIVKYELFCTYKVRIEFKDYEKFTRDMKNYEIIYDNTDFSDRVEISFACKKAFCNDIIKRINDITSGKATVQSLGERFDCL